MVLYAFLLLLLPPQSEVGPRRHIGRQDESRYRNSVLCVWSQARSALQRREPFKQEAGDHPVTPPHLASAPTRGRHNGRDSLVGRVHFGAGKGTTCYPWESSSVSWDSSGTGGWIHRALHVGEVCSDPTLVVFAPSLLSSIAFSGILLWMHTLAETGGEAENCTTSS